MIFAASARSAVRIAWPADGALRPDISANTRTPMIPMAPPSIADNIPPVPATIPAGIAIDATAADCHMMATRNARPTCNEGIGRAVRSEDSHATLHPALLGCIEIAHELIQSSGWWSVAALQRRLNYPAAIKALNLTKSRTNGQLLLRSERHVLLRDAQTPANAASISANVRANSCVDMSMPS